MAVKSKRFPIPLCACMGALLAVLALLTASSETVAAAGKPAAAVHSGHQRSGNVRLGIGQRRAVRVKAGCFRRTFLSSRSRNHRARSASRHRRQQRRLRRRARRICAARKSSAPAASTAPAAPLYWGAWIGSHLTGTEAPWDMSAVTTFEQSVGKSLSLLHFAAPFADCSRTPCSFYRFPTGAMEDIRKHGAIPFFDWSSQSTPSSVNEPDFQLSDVIAGTYDSYIREFATEVQAWGKPFFLRFNWEMNGDWFPWSEGVNGNRPGEYVAAWRHVHDIFNDVGATNATWVWCPNVDPNGEFQDLAGLYPGDEYVDWTGLDGYNWGTMPSQPSGWVEFDRLFRSTYEEITTSIAPSKPLVIGEVGSSEYGGSKSEWITEMLRDVPREYPSVRGLLWFDKTTDGDWQIETSTSATAAFAAGIQAAPYRDNSYGSLGPGPVQPPLG